MSILGLTKVGRIGLNIVLVSLLILNLVDELLRNLGFGIALCSSVTFFRYKLLRTRYSQKFFLHVDGSMVWVSFHWMTKDMRMDFGKKRFPNFVDVRNVARVSPSLLIFALDLGGPHSTLVSSCTSISFEPAEQLLHFCHIRLLLWDHFNLDLQFFRPTCLPCLMHFQDPVSDRPDISFFCLLLDFDHHLQVKHSFAQIRERNPFIDYFSPVSRQILKNL